MGYAGNRSPWKQSQAPAQQEAVRGRLPLHRGAGPPRTCSNELPAPALKITAGLPVATHLSPAVPPAANLTCWSFSATVSTSAASPGHQLIHCAKQYLYIESCSHAG